jgi:hypothetical protein
MLMHVVWPWAGSCGADVPEREGCRRGSVKRWGAASGLLLMTVLIATGGCVGGGGGSRRSEAGGGGDVCARAAVTAACG